VAAYSIQCSGKRGVWAIVHNGYVVLGGNNSNVHSKHAVTNGIITLDCPFNPSFLNF